MNIKHLRNEMCLSQYELSEATGIPRWRIQLIEQKIFTPSADESARLLTVLKNSQDDSGNPQ